MSGYMDSNERYEKASNDLNSLHERFRILRNVNLASLGSVVLGGAAIVYGAITGHDLFHEAVEGIGVVGLVGGLGSFALTGVTITSMAADESRLIAEKQRYRPQSPTQ